MNLKVYQRLPKALLSNNSSDIYDIKAMQFIVNTKQKHISSKAYSHQAKVKKIKRQAKMIKE